ncbi:MAG TPA: FlgD immunoglobulin-like domain containing protein, partial [Candidatus Acidoferrum sp.]|nr:FlgD immunoglobulin-like domain containing protein [Candidatus Acidoferrum sp.]
GLPQSYGLSQNYPNPFNPTTQISFALPKASQVELTVFNVLGQEVKTLVSGQMDAGSHTVVWDGTNSAGQSVSSGIYFYRISADQFSATKKMLMLK